MSFRRRTLLAGTALLLASPSRGEFVRREPTPSKASTAATQERSREILERTFDNLYDCDIRAMLTLTLHNKRDEQSIRRAEVARKRIRGRTHAYGRFVDPLWMRGTALLVIDNEGRSDDHFLFLPDQRRIRRVTSVQRTDAFLGSDLWYEDLERRHPDDYHSLSLEETVVQGEASWIVRAQPRDLSGYSSVEFSIAQADYFLLYTAYYRGRSEQPFRSIRTSRKDALGKDGHLLPIVLEVRNLLRGTLTEARFEQLAINPEISDKLFSAAALELGHSIPGLTR